MEQVEVAIAMFDSQNSNGCRVGDIVIAREPLGYFGRKEACMFVWALMSNATRAPLMALNERNEDGPKYRHKVRDAVLNDIDMDRAMDMEDEYQPLLSWNKETGEYAAVEPALRHAIDVVEKGR